MNKVIGPYLIKDVLGSGQFGKVHYSIHRESNEPTAIKIISMDSFRKTPKLSEFLQNETKILTTITHKNIIKFLTMYHSSRNLYIVYEFCNGGNLDEHIKSKKKLDQDEALYIFEQIIEGFRELRKHNILHRDLKPSNILLHDSFVKIADFGFCKEIFSNNELSSTMVGSPIYMAPEILKGQPYSSKADIWSLGTVLFEMIFGKVPFYETNIVSLINRFEKGGLEIPQDIIISENMANLLKQLLTIDDKFRISWEILLDDKKVKAFSFENDCSTSESLESMPEIHTKQFRNQLLITSTILTLVLENSIKSLTIPVSLYLVSVIKDLKTKCQNSLNYSLKALTSSEVTEIKYELKETDEMLDEFKKEVVCTFGSPIFFDSVPKLSAKVKLNISEYIEELLERNEEDQRSKWLVLAFAILDCVLVDTDFLQRLENGKDEYFKNIKLIGKPNLRKEVMTKLDTLFDHN